MGLSALGVLLVRAPRRAATGGPSRPARPSSASSPLQGVVGIAPVPPEAPLRARRGCTWPSPRARGSRCCGPSGRPAGSCPRPPAAGAASRPAGGVGRRARRRPLRPHPRPGPPRLLAVGGFIFLESMGVPSPGETALALGAIAAARGRPLDRVGHRSSPRRARSSGTTSASSSGATAAGRLLERPGPFYERRLRAARGGRRVLREATGRKAVFFGRWVALVRVTTAWMAGRQRDALPAFFVFNALGGITLGDHVGVIAYSLGEAGAHVLTRVGTGARGRRARRGRSVAAAVAAPARSRSAAGSRLSS